MHDVLREQQFALAQHLRDPATHAPPPGLEERRLRIYRELFFNSIEGLLAAGFPVIRETLGDKRWRVLVRAFYAGHRSRTPLFPQIAGEFVDYLEGRDGGDDIPPWLPELAHYEWVEQALFTSDAQAPGHDPDGDLMEGVPVLSPLALPLAYRWPVTDIGPGHVPRIAPDAPTTLLVHRDGGHQVRFTRIAPLAYCLLASLQANAWTGREHLATLAAQTGADAESVLAQGRELLQALRAQGVVIGTVA
ncbi:putative DNA-binding domain-containing protein [Lysobacter sp. S4-A87]|uniref:HvfC family RiPP maturation protein n=1 Tax=Lysobacter sp. S4-A87 TaxID=2925843 RepID=UPI001F52F433|nr:putative DNA-binding domain-containing protein [Lysobacter sp. S4-A87]UNK48723.1 putative DNA-binding domain-containing protein [Lysobacter sp. S4-A87]